MALRSRFAKYVNPILTALKVLGGSIRLGEVCDWVAERLGVSDAERSVKMRDGASQIELVDGQALVTLLEKLELGLAPRKTFEVDLNFFDEFARLSQSPAMVDAVAAPWLSLLRC